MTKDEIFQIVKNHIVEILPHLDGNQINIKQSLTDLGASSMDRSDVAIMAMDELDIDIPMGELLKINNIEDLVNALYTYSEHK